jgi:chromosome segregation protein
VVKFARLKLHGFKSFCDSTELEFKPGLTGVVGPNGCGKSNLVEALRWVMGESSYKAMRASGMDDVIFAGSGNRPGRNSAEVTVVLDNSARTAPAHLNTADVLEVTRRIEREAGSIYRVNGKEVRARDVQLLFADASTGAHSPALVRQGQIGELIAAKPQQRRALLEEAAGISGLHSRRHEAELRLRAAEQNLERIDDIIAQIEQQLETLKRQARLAARYKALSGDIRQTEATLFHIRWVAARVAENEAEADKGRIVRQLADAEHLDLEAQKVHFIADRAVTPAREREAAAAAALQRLVIAREQAEAAARDNLRRRDEADRHLHQVLEDAAREAAQRDEADGALAAVALERTQIEASRAEADGAFSAAESRFTAESERAIALESAVRQAAEALAALRADREARQRARTEAEARIERLNRQADDLARQMAELDLKIAETGGLVDAQLEREALVAAIAGFETDLVRAGQTILDTEAGAELARTAFQAADSEATRLETEARTLARLVASPAGADYPPVIDQLSVDPGYEAALGAALGDDLDASATDGAPIRWATSGAGTDDPALPMGVVPLSARVRGVSALMRRLQQIGVVDADSAERLFPALLPGQRLVTREGALWRWDGLVARADAPSAQAVRLEQRNRLAEVQRALEPALSHRASGRVNLDSALGALASARTEEKRLRDAVRDAQQREQRARNRVDELERAAASVVARRDGLNEAATSLATTRAEAVDALARIGAAGAAGDAETASATALALAEQRLAEGRSAVTLARAEVQRLQTEDTARRMRLDRLTTEQQGAERRRDSALRQIAALAAREAEARAQLLSFNTDPDAEADRPRARASQIATAEDAHRQAGDALARAESQRREAEKALRLTTEALGALRTETARLDERVKGFQGQRAQLERQVAEALGVGAAETARLAGLRPEQELPKEMQVEERLNRLKAERERLGGVNLAADSEAEEVREKLDLMVTDRNDLIAAIAALRSGIQNLNREGRQRLGEAFEKVNAHFKDLFTSLFGGGTAELQFVDSDDPLEAGLEIIARPPGKKPTTMTLLSGGEQALTAMSLIFAVFLTNPAPICVLDEVDAPLDDANVERFCTLLTTMTEKTDTRFLVITHNPITMARVDRLYGVTMAEKGVSQLVSVDLAAAERVRLAS